MCDSLLNYHILRVFFFGGFRFLNSFSSNNGANVIMRAQLQDLIEF